ncbi:MAG: transglycosylase SLT domain-containing protein [Candidatus Pacearchaeota archaeon]
MRRKSKNVVALFLIASAILFSSNFISAQFSQGGTGQEFGLGQTGGEFSESYSSSYVQYSEPGFIGHQAFAYTDPRENFEICRQRQDFIFQIAPGGCSPSVVRSDLLAEQNVLVFCKLSAIQINPTIDPSRIRNIRFAPVGNVSGYILSFPYLRPKTLLNSINNNGFGTLNNAGYLGIYLRQQPNENLMPDFISGNLTAFVDYDVQEGFGAGFIERPIPVLSDEEWRLRYKEYGFMNGLGYLRVEEVRSDRVLVGIYTDVNRRYTSFAVEKGKTSQEVYLPGLYCNSALSVSFLESEVPKIKAKIFLDDNEIEFYEGDRFGNACQAGKISIEENGDSSVSLICNGKRMLLSLNKRDVKLTIDNENKNARIGDLLYSSEENGNNKNVYLGYSGVLKDGKEFVLLVSSQKSFNEISDAVRKKGESISENNFPNPEIENGEGKLFSYIGVLKDSSVTFNDKNIGLTGFLTAPQGSDDAETNLRYNIAATSYNDINSKFKQISFPNIIEGSYGKKSLKDLFELSKFVGKNKEANEIAKKINEEYGEIVSSDSILQDVDYSGAYDSFELGGITHNIRLVSVSNPSFEELGVIVSVDGGKTNLQKGDYLIPLEIINGKQKRVVVRDILEDKIVLEGSCVTKDGIVSSVNENIELFSSKVICNTNIKVEQINIKKSARIKINSNNKHLGSVTNISYAIGIEKRAFPLSPEKSLARIKRLNESIDKWQNISDSLSKGVKGMKAACFTTSAALQVKNLFGNLGGKAIARTAAMERWHSLCDESLAKNGIPLDGMSGSVYRSKDDCFRQNANAIEEDVNLIFATQKAVNEEIKQMEQQGGFVKSEGALGGGAVDPKAKDNYVDKVLKNQLRNSDLELIDPNDPEKKRKIVLKDFVGNLKPESITYSQARDLVMYFKLASSKNERVKALANDKLYNLAEAVNQNKQFDNARSEASKITNSLRINGQLYANLPPLPRRQQPAIYGGALFDNQPVEYVVYRDENGNTKDYLVYLKNVHDDVYIIENAKEISKTNGGYVIPNDNRNNNNGFVDNEVLNKIKGQYPQFRKYDSGSFRNPYQKPEVIYHETEPYKGMPAVVPIDLRNGWYAATKNTLPAFGNIKAFQDSGRVQSFWLCNVGANGRQEFNSGIGDDYCGQFNLNTGQKIDEFYGLTDAETKTLVDKARRSLEEAASKYKPGIQSVYISVLGTSIPVGNPAPSLPGTHCADFMSPKDCQLLFNVCDPVICPSSRCNLGGKYYVDNVVQTGIVGGIFMCLPNYREGIIVPVCLTGIQAGVDNYVSIMKASRDCLTESVKTGRYVGICDEITAIYKCEFFWRQVSPAMNVMLPKLLERVTGGGVRGGGEYMNVQAAWGNMQNSIDYFKNLYAVNALKSFRVRSTQEVGTPICKSFVSTKFPKKFKTLIEPESPPQFVAWFDEIPQTDATAIPRSHYKVFYHIYAGNDEGIQYSVYLRNAEGISFFQSTGNYIVDTGFVGRGDYVDQARDFVAPSGFKELCVRVNAQEECGFKQVSTSFALNYLRDKYIQEQAKNTQISSEKECVSGTPSLYPLINPNLQSGVQEAVIPQIYSRGIIRVCATHNPGGPSDSSRWQDVGFCGDQKIRCWIDRNSISNAISDGHIGAVNKTLDALNEAARLQAEGYKGVLLNKESEGIAFKDADAKFKELKDMSMPQRGDRESGYNEFVNKAREVSEAVNKIEEEYSLTNEQQARADYLKAQAYDIVTRAAWNSRAKNEEPPQSSSGNGGGNGAGNGQNNNGGQNNQGIPNEENNLGVKVIVEGTNYNYQTLSQVIDYVKNNQISNGDQNKGCYNNNDKEAIINSISKYSEQYDVNPLLVLAVIIQESECKQFKNDGQPTTDGRDSYGLMQVNEITYNEICKRDNTGSSFDEIKTNIPKNIQCGVRILSEKHTLFGHDWCDKDSGCKEHKYSANSNNKDKKCHENSCYYRIKCNGLDKYYTGWAATLRAYNGWACSGDNNYVERVNTIYENLKKIYKEKERNNQ